MTRVKASEYLFLADMLPADRDGNVVGVRDFQAQCTQVFSDIKTALGSAVAEEKVAWLE